MDKDSFKTNIKAAKELVQDEQKIVTYISLSKELCIHVNDAKTILSQLIKDIKENHPKTEICISYMISGLLSDNSACTTVCPETEVESLQATLKVLFYKHVYCISRGDQPINKIALSTINTFSDFALCRGLIKAHTCIKRTEDEIEKLSSFRNQNTSTEINTNNVVKKEKTKDTNKNNQDVKKIIEVKSEPKTPSKPATPPKSKTPSPKKDKSTSNTKGSNKTNSSKPAGKGIAGFFNKANGDTKKVNNIKVKEEKPEIKPKIEKDTEVKSSNTSVKSEKEKPVDKEINEKDKSLNKSNNSKDSSLKQIKKSAKVDKKRKRLLHVSDSESETEINDPLTDYESKMAVDQESDDEIPPTPSTNTVKITSGIVNAKKKRKIVDKTYTDEDGYILTKKEEVYESCSDNEDGKQEKENIDQVKKPEQVTEIKREISVKENGKKKKKLSPPQKGKQQMLTNFFKKV